MPLKDTIAKAQEKLDSGDLGRAKEIIRSSLHNYKHDPQLLEFYGEILFQMKDRYQAGKYFFFSVDQAKEHQKEAIKLFLKRHQRAGYQGILASTPYPYVESLSDYPPYAREHLLQLGAPEKLVKWTSKLAEVTLPIGCMALLLAFIGLSIVGLVTVLKWIF